MAKQMIKGLTMLTMVVALALVTAVTSANAQTTGRVAAHVPFQFVVGDKTLPAGEYKVAPMSSTSGVLRITDNANENSAIRLSNAVVRTKEAKNGKLVFHRYGGQYFLAEVWTSGDSTGRSLAKSNAEKTAARDLAAIPSTNNPARNGYELVEVALLNQ